jgi:hypothetical protein
MFLHPTSATLSWSLGLTRFSLSVKALSDRGNISPAAIAADPVTGDIFIISYTKNEDTGYPGYNLPSYVNQYSADGTFKKRYDCGVGPISIVFNTSVKYE